MIEYWCMGGEKSGLSTRVLSVAPGNGAGISGKGEGLLTFW